MRKYKRIIQAALFTSTLGFVLSAEEPRAVANQASCANKDCTSSTHCGGLVYFCQCFLFSGKCVHLYC